MKIEGPGKSSAAGGVSKTDKKKKTGDSGFSSLVGESESAGSAASVSGLSPVNQLDALLSLQEAGDGTSGGSKQSRKRATALLDELDKVRMGLLTGGIPADTLRHLTHMVGQHRERVMDPALAEVLDEIDLRVQVELAKLGR